MNNQFVFSLRDIGRSWGKKAKPFGLASFVSSLQVHQVALFETPAFHDIEKKVNIYLDLFITGSTTQTF